MSLVPQDKTESGNHLVFLGIWDDDIHTAREHQLVYDSRHARAAIPWCCGHVTCPKHNSSASPTSCLAGCADFCSTTRSYGQGRGQIATALTGSPYVQARHGPDGDDSQAEHEGVQTNRRKQHLKWCTNVTQPSYKPKALESMSGDRQEIGDRRATVSNP